VELCLRCSPDREEEAGGHQFAGLFPKEAQSQGRRRSPKGIYVEFMDKNLIPEKIRRKPQVRLFCKFVKDQKHSFVCK